MTVLGTTLPVFVLAFTTNMYIYGIMLSISGFFSATFALTFAYISDCVDSKHRAPAYGLALATFGLSFTVGPLAGSYIAVHFGEQSVFLLSVVLVLVNVVYIVSSLPETAKLVNVSFTAFNFSLWVLQQSTHCKVDLSAFTSQPYV